METVRMKKLKASARELDSEGYEEMATFELIKVLHAVRGKRSTTEEQATTNIFDEPTPEINSKKCPHGKKISL